MPSFSLLTAFDTCMFLLSNLMSSQVSENSSLLAVMFKSNKWIIFVCPKS